MSRVGKNPVPVPNGVTVDISATAVTAKGKLGQLSLALTDAVVVSREGDAVSVQPANDTLQARKMWGTTRANIKNMVTGVSQGYSRNLEINGVGYRAQVQGKELVLQLGFSHDVRYPVPAGITIECPEQTKIVIKGADKQRVGQVAAEIRAYRPPEPYKGKGVKYDTEIITRKEGKKK